MIGHHWLNRSQRIYERTKSLTKQIRGNSLEGKLVKREEKVSVRDFLLPTL